MYSIADSNDKTLAYYEGMSLATNDLQKMARLSITRQDQELLHDFINRGVISGDVLDVVTEDYIDLDLFIEAVTTNFTEVHQVEHYIGDTFGAHFFGYKPMVINCQATLLDTDGNNAKYYFMKLYNEVFRLRKVAQMKITPVLEFAGCMAKGAFLGLQTVEDAEKSDLVLLNFYFLVINMYVFNPENGSGITQTDVLFDVPSALAEELEGLKYDRSDVRSGVPVPSGNNLPAQGDRYDISQL